VDSDSELDDATITNRENVELNGIVGGPSLFLNATEQNNSQIGSHMIFLERSDTAFPSSSSRQQPQMLFQPSEIGLSFLKRISSVGTSAVNEWMSHDKLKALEAQGEIKVRKGKFSSIEEELLTQIVRVWLEERNLGPEDLLPYLNRKLAPGLLEPHKRKEFWRYIASHFPDRTMSSLYLRINRRFHPSNQESGWTKEELEHLRVLVAQFGTNWQEIGRMLGRFPENCRTRWRSIKHLYEEAAPTAAAEHNNQNDDNGDSEDENNEEQDGDDVAAAPAANKPTGKSRRMTGEEQSQVLALMLDRMPRMHKTVEDPGNGDASLPLPPNTIHVEDLRCALQSSAAYPWTEVREELARRHPQQSNRNADFLRLHWKLVIEPNLVQVCNNTDEQLLHYDQLLSKVRQGKDKRFTVGTSVAMLRRIKSLYPDAFLSRDIVWTEVHKSPEFVGKSYRACKRVFDTLLRTYIPENSPLYVHVVGVKSLGTFPPIIDAIDYMIAALSVKPADETVGAKRKKRQ
jgi:hypothetical protein